MDEEQQQIDRNLSANPGDKDAFFAAYRGSLRSGKTPTEVRKTMYANFYSQLETFLIGEMNRVLDPVPTIPFIAIESDKTLTQEDAQRIKDDFAHRRNINYTIVDVPAVMARNHISIYLTQQGIQSFPRLENHGKILDNEGNELRKPSLFLCADSYPLRAMGQELPYLDAIYGEHLKRIAQEIPDELFPVFELHHPRHWSTQRERQGIMLNKVQARDTHYEQDQQSYISPKGNCWGYELQSNGEINWNRGAAWIEEHLVYEQALEALLNIKSQQYNQV